jgi:nucleoside-diphosphate-sugar epimerase
MKVLVTGASGRLGRAVCAGLFERGFDVRATDQRFAAGLPVPVELANLLDEHAAYRLLEGCEALVHLANHPNLFVGPSPQRLLAENTAMNANVFRAAADLGVQNIVFSSSIQVMVTMPGGEAPPPPYTLPYLPLDGAAPRNPGPNFYALSKELGERALQVLCEEKPALSATSLRFPVLAGDGWFRRFARRKVPQNVVNFGEGLTFLTFADAARVVSSVCEIARAGYRQLFPAATLDLAGLGAPEIIAAFYPETRLLAPRETITRLVDPTELEALGCAPRDRFEIELERAGC